jgi:methionyl-tRNA synthetase
MSKSLGNVLDPFEVIDRFGADPLRFYCFREVSFGQDGAVSADGFETRYETELANDFGNLASRTLAMLERYRDGTVPDGPPDPALAEGEDGLEGVSPQVQELFNRAEISHALDVTWRRVRRLNRYVEEVRPWDLAKDDGGVERLDSVLYSLAEGLRVVTLLLYPYIPETADKLLSALGEEDRGLADFGSRGGGFRIERIPPLFPKIEA